MPLGSSPDGSDVGLQAVNGVRQTLMIEDEWATPFDRGFSWWSYRLAQHVRADPPSSDGRMEFSTLRISTDLVRDVTHGERAVEILGVANMQQSLNALVWDADQRTVRESCTAVVTEENLSWLGSVVATAAAIQNSAAHSRAHALAEVLGGVPATSEHPTSGEREDRDDILQVPEAVVAAEGKRPSAFHGDLIERLGGFVEQIGLLGFADGSGFTCEVPFTGSRPSAEVIASLEPIETALVQIDPDISHPEFGNGALLILRLPTSIQKPQAAEWANWLNHLEATSMTDTSLLGAWCPDPTQGGDGLAFTAFVPNVLARGGLLENLVIYQSVRSRLAAGYLDSV